MKISIKAGVLDSTSMFTWDPLLVDFGEILEGEKGKIAVELTNQNSRKKELTVISPPSEEFIKKYKIKKKKLKSGKSTKVEFELARDIPIGRFYASLTLEAKGDPASRITIPIKGQVVKEKSPPTKETQAKVAPKKTSAKSQPKKDLSTKSAQKKVTDK